MNYALAFVGGVLVGALVVIQLRENESSCCKRVAQGGRDKVTGMFGEIGGELYDALNLGAVVPAALDVFGVPP